jgi:hypothetical protein
MTHYKRLLILCEGQTEEVVFKDFFNPLCPQLSIKVWSAYGAGKLMSIYVKQAESALAEDAALVVFCFIDLKQVPFTFPKNVESNANPIAARFQYLQQQMKAKINEDVRPRFFAFPVVMELETWILADAEGLSHYLREKFPVVTTPETIENPVDYLKPIIKRARGEAYGKEIGQIKTIFKHISAQRVYDDNCPHFELIINQLYELQAIEPPKQSRISPPQFPLVDPSLLKQLTVLDDEKEVIWQQALKAGDFTAVQIARIAEIEAEISQIWQDIASHYPP